MTGTIDALTREYHLDPRQWKVRYITDVLYVFTASIVLDGYPYAVYAIVNPRTHEVLAEMLSLTECEQPCSSTATSRVTLRELERRFELRNSSQWQLKCELSSELHFYVAYATVGYDGFEGGCGVATCYDLCVIANPHSGEVYDYEVLQIERYSY